MNEGADKLSPARAAMKMLRGGVVLFLFVGLLQACDGIGSNFLEQPPSVDVTKDTVFTDPELTERFLWNAYRTLPYGPGSASVEGGYDRGKLNRDMLASLTDINQTFMMWGGVIPTYYEAQGFPWNPNRDKYNYNGSNWDGIRRSHIFIENVGQTPGIDPATKERMKAEARMIIAVHYTDMFRNFGGLPWVNHAYDVNEDTDNPRLTARATLDSILSVIDTATPDLPFVLENPETDAGRFTQAGALGLKCRLLTFAASPLFNDTEPYMQGEAADKEMMWYGGYDAGLWQRAADACGAAINEAGQSHHLLDTGNPRQDFQDAYYDRDSPEVLISTRVRFRSPNGSWAGYYYGEPINPGSGGTTHNYVQMFPMADGTPIDDPNSGYDPQNPYENRDPRLYETVLVNGDVWQGRTAETWIGGRERQSKGSRDMQSGYRVRKFLLDEQSAFGSVVHWPYLRLPEIYLSYAEALNEVHGGPTDEAYRYVNMVRNRVGLNDLPTGLSQDEFREALLRERVLEFGYEEVRWYDMVRHKREDIFTKTLYGMDILPNDDGTFTYETFELPGRHWQDNFSPRWYLSPFPQPEINKGYGLVQNPGWEL